MSHSLAALLKKSSLDNHEALLQASEAALKSSSNDAQAQQVKAVALLKLERYSDALQFFATNKSLQDGLAEAYAYALYKSNKFEDAVRVASSAKDSRGALHLVLQAAYRAEDWDTANTAYASLAGTDISRENFDLRINKLALDAEGLWLQKLQPTSVARAKTDDLATFETAYNSACISVAKGQLEEADILLKRAINLCEHSEDLSEDEKPIELVPLKAQRLFVLESSGKQEEASTAIQDIQKLLDSATIDVKARKLAETNLLAISQDKTNPFLTHKHFAQTSIPKHERFFAKDEASLSLNEKTIQLQTFKYDGLVKAAKRTLLPEALPSLAANDLLTAMFDVAARARSDVSKAAIKKVLPELEKRPNDVGLAVTIVQMYVLTGNTTAAVDLMQSFFDRLEKSSSQKDQDVRFSPGLVGLMAGLYRAQGRRSQLKQELAKSASYWRTKSKAPPSLLRAAGVVLLESSSEDDAKAAQEIFEKLYSQQPNDRGTIAGYVASHASESSTNVQSLAAKLTPVEELIAAVDVDTLEASGIPQSANALAIAQAGQSRKRRAIDGIDTGNKRLRKSRLPKDFDPNKKPDPERWLPLRDRSTYRPKKKKGRKDDRTQGGGNVNESLDISNKSSASASDIVAGNSGSNKKKKGKGKK